MEIRENDFSEFVLEADRPVLVDFWASWCPPCKMMQPVVDRLGQKVADWADVYSVNIDRSPALASQFSVSGVPTFISFAGGRAVDRKTGALTEGQLMSLLNIAKDSMPADSNSSNSAGLSDSDAVVTPVSVAEVSEDSSQQTAHLSSTSEFITVVSGLPRSGTSMMMRMLEAGGIAALTDSRRTADDDNPNGYYEFEDVKSLADHREWLNDAAGKAVKMVYSLLKHLPVDREYRVIFMRRHVDEILQSQKKMLERNGILTDVADDQMRTMFDRELRQFYAWLPSQPHLKLINVSYNELLLNPAPAIHQVNRHLEQRLDADSMIRMVDPALYRHRAA